MGVLLRMGLVLVACGATGVAAAAPRDGGGDAAPTLLQAAPEDGARLEESSGWLEVRASSDLREVCIVVSRHTFDPSTWSALPEGSEWIIARDVGQAVEVADLGISARTETPLWWAATGREARNGAFRVTPVRRFLLGPRFANRAAPGARLAPTAMGWLGAEKATAPEARPPHPLVLTAGYTLVPGAGSPRVAADLARASDAMHAELSRTATSRGAYLVWFSDLSPESARDRVVRAGGTIVAVLPEGALLVRMEERQRTEFAKDSSRPWVEAWEPAYKISRHIDRARVGSAALTALAFPDADADAVAARLRGLGASAVSVHRNGINQLLRFELEGARVAEAAAIADLTWIEPTPRDSILNDQAQWVVQTNVPESRRLWDLGLRGQGQVLMTSDSGIRTNHEMFFDPAQDITGFGDFPLHRKIIAYQRGSDHSLVEFGDDAGSNYHGTHTAGTVAGNNDPTTTNPLDGMAKDAKLYFMDLGGTHSNGSIAPPADLNDLFLPSYNGNTGGSARISSNSWGAFGSGSYTLGSMQVDQFMWNHPDYLILFANGNNGVAASVNSPATAKNCVSVGGTGNGAARQSFYAATSRGPTNDLRRKPTIAGPADLVASSVGTTRYAYDRYSGTSMATPAAAGALALVRQYLTEGWYPTGAPVAANAFTPSAALLKAMAVNSGENDVGGAFVPDNKVGWGRINIDNVLYLPGDERQVLLLDATAGLMDRQFVEYQVQVGDPVQPFSVSLCWTDAPGNPVVVPQLVNDLDLVVSNGTETYLGNRMFNGVSLVGAGRDSFNVEECVRVPAPVAGLWTVRVEGHRVLVGPQPYALCITGGVGQGTGSIALERYDYALNDLVTIEVLDTNATGPVPVTVTSPTDPWGETVQLEGADGVFRGTVMIAPAAPNPYDHRLAVSSGDAITVTYADLAPPMSVSATAGVNVLAPVITEVHAEPLSGTTARITWTTDVLSTSLVQFGENGGLGRTQETSGYTRHHEVRLSGLRPARNYQYDVVSVTRTGAVTRDNLGGMHRTFTTKTTGHLALVLNDAPAQVLPTWLNAIEALGWDVDVLTGSDVEPPLVGNKSTGLRSYSCVLWQVGTDDYPPISDAQRAAIDSLLEGGARLLVTGHDIGYGMADASVFSYTPEREAWLERGLKTRYYYDELTGISTILGTSGDPISGAYGAGIPYYQVRRGSTSDLVGVAPGTDGQGSVNWLLSKSPAWPCGLRWESDAPKGQTWEAFWGGQRSRLAVLYFEWTGLATQSAAPAPARTDVLEKSVAWLLERRPPSVTITSPLPGAVVTSDVLPIRYSLAADTDRTIASRSISYSLDGGETWKTLSSSAAPDSMYLWDIGGTQGGTPTPNSTSVLLRIAASDDGAPPLSGRDVMNTAFTIARPGGDAQGPVVVAGTLRITPNPVRGTSPATLQATFSDAASGGASVAAAEYSWGATPAPAGTGTPMTVASTPPLAEVQRTLPPNTLPLELVTLWVRAQDTAGRWGPAAALSVVVNADERTDVAEIPRINYVASVPPTRGATKIRFGLARAAEIRLELFDVRGRRVRSLAMGRFGPGTHLASWDAREDSGALASSGVFLVRLMVAQDTYTTRLVHFR